MIFEQLDAGGDRNFSYLVGDETSRACAVVDPGYDTSKVEARGQALGLRVAYVLNTHTHHDHVAGNGIFHRGDVKLAAYRTPESTRTSRSSMAASSRSASSASRSYLSLAITWIPSACWSTARS